MAQTKFNTILVGASGHRFVMQNGSHAFGNTQKVTLTTSLHRVVAALFTPEQVIAQKHTSAIGSYIPFMSASQLTLSGLPTKGRVIVSRLRKNMTALKFTYTLVGW